MEVNSGSAAAAASSAATAPRSQVEAVAARRAGAVRPSPGPAPRAGRAPTAPAGSRGSRDGAPPGVGSGELGDRRGGAHPVVPDRPDHVLARDERGVDGLEIGNSRGAGLGLSRPPRLDELDLCSAFNPRRMLSSEASSDRSASIARTPATPTEQPVDRPDAVRPPPRRAPPPEDGGRRVALQQLGHARRAGRGSRRRSGAQSDRIDDGRRR